MDIETSVRPMGFREAMRYGFNAYREVRREEGRLEQERNKRHGIHRRGADWYAPGITEPTVEVPRIMMDLAMADVFSQRREEGKPYDEEFLEEQERKQKERERFYNSPWSRLFRILMTAD